MIKDSLKTPSSRRKIAISETIVNLLKAHKHRQAEIKMANRDVYKDLDLVFEKNDGQPFCNLVISRKFTTTLKKMNIMGFTFHSLRHFFASQLLANGENVKLVQKALGHKDASITLNTYIHVMPNAHASAAKRLEKSMKMLI